MVDSWWSPKATCLLANWQSLPPLRGKKHNPLPAYLEPNSTSTLYHVARGLCAPEQGGGAAPARPRANHVRLAKSWRGPARSVGVSAPGYEKARARHRTSAARPGPLRGLA